MSVDARPVSIREPAWIDPEGRRLAVRLDPGDAATMVEAGWIGIERETDGYRLLVRERAVRRQGARALSELAHAGGEALDAPARSSRGAGSLRSLVREILDTSWDALRYPDPAIQVEHRVGELRRARADGARFAWLADAASSGALDRAELSAALSRAAAATGQAIRAVRDCHAGIDRRGSPEAARVAAGRGLDRLEAAQAKLREGCTAALGAIVGAGAAPVADPGVPTLDPDPLRTLRAIHPDLEAARREVEEGRRVLRAACPHGTLLARALALDGLAALPGQRIATVRQALAAAGLSAARVSDITCYEIGHECGRSYHSLRRSLDEVRKALREIPVRRDEEPGGLTP